MRQARWTWLAAVGFVLALSACDDEIVDVDLPKADAAADRADAPREATSDGGGPSDDAATDGGGPSDDAATDDSPDTSALDDVLVE